MVTILFLYIDDDAVLMSDQARRKDQITACFHFESVQSVTVLGSMFPPKQYNIIRKYTKLINFDFDFKAQEQEQEREEEQDIWCAMVIIQICVLMMILY